MNWPNEPPTLITPKAVPRYSNCKRWAAAPISTEKLLAKTNAASNHTWIRKFRPSQSRPIRQMGPLEYLSTNNWGLGRSGTENLVRRLSSLMFWFYS